MLIDRWILEMTELQVAQFLGIAAGGCHSRGALPLVSGEIFETSIRRSNVPWVPFMRVNSQQAAGIVREYEEANSRHT